MERNVATTTGVNVAAARWKPPSPRYLLAARSASVNDQLASLVSLARHLVPDRWFGAEVVHDLAPCLAVS